MVVSALVATFTTPTQGVYCARCARREAVRATLVTAIAGWWGFPWGPILTIREIVRNALGGERPKGAEQRMLWFNAIAFARRGDFVLAYGLARRVQSLKGDELRSHASDLISELHKRGVPRDTPPLKSPWGVNLRSVGPHVMALCAPFALILLLGIGADFAQSHPAASHASAGASEAPDGPTPSVDASASAPPSPVCATPPTNGQIMAGWRPRRHPGHSLQIQNGAEGPVIVKVRHAENGRLAFSFFVEQGATATIRGIPDGAYRFQYAIGTSVAVDCLGLNNIQDVEEFPDTETFVTSYTDTEVETQTLSYTLYSVPDGNVRPRSIDVASFNAA
jgi:hypothetical protein